MIMAGMANRYTVYPAQSADFSELAAFFRAAYADQFNASEYRDEKKIARKWEWANTRNPYKENFRSTAWICRENVSGKIAGHLGITPVSLKYKDGYYPGAWGRDLIVSPEFRTRGIGPFLVDSVLKEVKDEAAIFMIAGVRDHVYPMYKKFGFSDMGHIPLYLRPNRPDHMIRGKVGRGLLSDILSILGNFAIKGFYTFSDARRYFSGRNKNISIAEISSFDDSFNKLWEEAGNSFDLIVRRDAAYLNWRFVSQDLWSYKIFKACRKDSSDASGYIVVRDGESRGVRTGVISDIFASSEDTETIASLFDFVIAYFAKRDDIALIRCDILNEKAAKAIKRSGFVNARSSERFMFINIKDGLDEAFFKDRGNWFINYADSDLDLSGQRIT